MSTAEKWCPPHHTTVHKQVGDYFADIVAKFLEGHTNGVLGWDVVNKEVGIGVEVKSRDNKHSFGINVLQMKRYERASEEHKLYCLVCYKNSQRILKGKKAPIRADLRKRVSGNTFSPLARIRSVEERTTFLKDSIDEMHLWDMQIVKGWGKHKGSRIDTFRAKRPKPQIELNRKEIRTPPVTMLSLLGLANRPWQFATYDMEVYPVTEEGRVQQVLFRLHTILSPETHSVVQKLVARHLFDPDLPF